MVYIGFFAHDSEVRLGCILLLEDEPDDRETWITFFTEEGWDVYAYGIDKDALDALDREMLWDAIDLAVLDFDLKESDGTGLQFASTVAERSESRIQSIILTGESPSISHRDAIKTSGAGELADFFAKTCDRDDLLDALRRLQRFANRMRAFGKLQRERAAGVAESLTNVRSHVRDTDGRIVRYVGPSLMNVLILGETGTSKEETAKLIHLASGLAYTDGPKSHRFWNWRVLNCGGLVNDNLLTSLLFGHVAGSFTGAHDHRLGAVLEAAGLRHEPTEYVGQRPEPFDGWLVRCADAGLRELINIRGAGIGGPGTHVDTDSQGGKSFPDLEAAFPGKCGTLFLDEVAELSKYAQAALLRFLDGYGFQPLGYYGPSLCPKVRIVAATNRSDLLFGDDGSSNEKSNTARQFRPDLLWRLMEWVIKMPPIDEREDEPIQAAQLLAADLKPGTPGTRHNASLEIAAQALDRLRTMIADEHRFSGPTPAQSGNYRSLRALVRRAAWMAATADSAETQAVISEDVLDEAAKMYIDIDITNPAPEPDGDDDEGPLAADAPEIDVQGRKRAVVEQAKYLGEQGRLHQPHEFTASEVLAASSIKDNLRLDVSLAESITSLLSHTGHGIDQKELFKEPNRALGTQMSYTLPRWQYVCTLGLFTAAHQRAQQNPYSWTTLNEELFGKGNFKKYALRDQYLPGILKPYDIVIFWSSNNTIAGPAAGFVQLFYEHNGVVRPFSELPKPEVDEAGKRKKFQHTDDRPQFYWQKDVSEAAKQRAYQFLTYLSMVADVLGLSKPWSGTEGDEAPVVT